MDALLAGSIARSTAGSILVPVSVVKTRFEGLGTNAYKSVFHALRTIGSTEGARGLFSGLIPTILRDAPYSGLYFLAYDQLKGKLNAVPELSQHHTLINGTSGISAGLLATVVTHPLDVVKTRLQFKNDAGFRMYQMILHMYKSGGIRVFYKGLVPRLIRRPATAAITWVVYEELTRIPSNK